MYNVYLISCQINDQKRYKIGYTKNSLQTRLNQLKTGNSEELKVEQVYQSKWGTKIESALHRNYKSTNIQGEWFLLTDKQVENFLIECKNLDFFFSDWQKNTTFANPKTILR